MTNSELHRRFHGNRRGAISCIAAEGPAFAAATFALTPIATSKHAALGSFDEAAAEPSSSGEARSHRMIRLSSPDRRANHAEWA